MGTFIKNKDESSKNSEVVDAQIDHCMKDNKDLREKLQRAIE